MDISDDFSIDSSKDNNNDSDNKKRKPRKKNNIVLSKTLIIFIAMLVIILALAVVSVILVFKLKESQKEAESHKYVLSDFVPAMNTRVYNFYDDGDSVFLEDGYYGEIRLPAFTNVPLHSYDYSGLKFIDGRYVYYQNDEVTSKTGIDVSYHQKDIDWKAVAADGIDFAMIRVGYRGYESGLLNLDEQFHNHVKGAVDAGINVGVYFFSQALTVEEAKEEAYFVLDIIDEYEITYPVAFDWEIMGVNSARTNSMRANTLTECAAAFCDTISDAGYMPMLYSGLRLALLKLDLSKLSDYDIWYAQYKDGHNPPELAYDFKMWQYASDGKVDGISGDVDLNISFVDYSTVVRGRY